MAEWLNAAVLKCLQLASPSLRKHRLGTLSHLSTLIRPNHVLFGEKIREKKGVSHIVRQGK